MTLDQLPADPLGDEEDIDVRFWEDLYYDKDRNTVYLEHGFAAQDHIPELRCAYTKLALKEADLNAIAKLQTILLQSQRRVTEPEKRNRRRKSHWEDWTAAIAVLAADGQIDGAMPVTTLRDKVDHQLQLWNLEISIESTIGPTLRAVIDRFAARPASDPPA